MSIGGKALRDDGSDVLSRDVPEALLIPEVDEPNESLELDWLNRLPF
jgi:hypothetical protein